MKVPEKRRNEEKNVYEKIISKTFPNFMNTSTNISKKPNEVLVEFTQRYPYLELAY